MAVYKYTHQALGEEMEAISGHYSLQKEGELPYKGRQVYYYTGYSVVDTSCCGPGGCGFALVIGYIVNWHAGKDGGGAYISDVEPLSDSGERQELTKMLMDQTHVQQVNFWTPRSIA
ncbi:MAG: hypothetical protein M1491_01295 [Deltaproteobacteria bacterium]|nr:hypothetical protein [Deltaproteobacteria bacterium]MCL5276854.1 hypothetical protein [Deltaproteobacteria bacterium]